MPPRLRLTLVAPLLLLTLPPSGRPAGPPLGLRTDRHGDLLPPQAVARMGAVRLRHGTFVNGVAFSRDGSVLASIGYHGLRFWDVRTGRLRRSVPPGSYVAQGIALTADGKAFVSVGADAQAKKEYGGLRFWSARDGKELRRVEDARWRPHFVALSPDGKSAAVGGQELAGVRKVRLLDLKTGKQVHSLDTKGDWYWGDYAPDGRLLALCGWHGTESVRLVNPATGEVVRELKGPGLRHSQGGAFSPDGKTLAAGATRYDRERKAWDCWVVLWDVSTGKQKARLTGHRASAVRVAFAPDGKTLASAGHDRSVILWDAATGKKRFHLAGLPDTAYSLAFTADSKLLAAGGYDGVVRVWDVATGKEAPGWGEAHGARLTRAVFTPDGRSLLTASADGTARLWDPATGAQRLALRGHEEAVRDVALSPDGKRVASAGADGTLRLWELATGREVREPRLGTSSDLLKSLEAVRFTTDGRGLVAVTRDLCVRSWDAGTGKEGATRPLAPAGLRRPGATDLEKDVFLKRTGGKALALSPDRKTLALHLPVMLGPAVVLLDTASGKERRRLEIHGGRYAAVAFSPGGRRLAVSGQEHAFSVYEVGTGAEGDPFGPRLPPASVLAWSRDGHYLASASDKEGDAIRLWDAGSGHEVLRLPGHPSEVTCLDFAPDGQTLAAGYADSTALVWGLAPAGRRSESPERLRKTDLARRWADLADADGRKAYAALWSLSAARPQAIAFLAARLRPVAAPDADHVGRLIRDLGNEEFEQRQRAERELAKLAELAEPALRRALAREADLEVVRRRQRLLKILEKRVPPSEEVRARRAVQVLERDGSKDARALLRRLAAGAEGATQTQDADAALARLARRPAALAGAPAPR